MVDPQLSLESGTRPNPDLARVLEVQDLSVKIGGRLLLDKVSFWVPKGEFVCLCGPNGAGKSTLLKTILGLIKPTSGTIKILGEQSRQATSSLGYVPQRKTGDARFPARVIDLIVASLRGSWPARIRDEEREEAFAALRRVGGESLLEKDLAGLSGGETQRAYLARALVTHPNIIILDEPTVGVDVRGRAEFLEILKQVSISDELTAVMVTHNLAAIARCAERVVYLEAGRMVAWGLPEELLGQKSLHAISHLTASDNQVLTPDED
jgi:zinc transport system ATP-binding protein